MGLSIAYHLARRGLDDVVVLERGYLAEGASGRNGGGVRQQWSTEINIRLMQESVELCRRFARRARRQRVVSPRRLSVPRAQRTRGRARSRRTSRCRTAAACRRACSTPREAQRHRARARPRRHRRRGVQPDDGIVFPWPFLWGYARQAAALRRRASSRRLPVTAIDAAAGVRLRVADARGAVRARSRGQRVRRLEPKLAAIDRRRRCRTIPIRHEICSREPLKPFLGPLVLDARRRGLYFSPVDARRDRRRHGRSRRAAAARHTRWAARCASSRATRARSPS